MGNCFGRESKNFSGEGRTLGAGPAPTPVNQQPTPVPQLQPGSPGRTVGGGAGSGPEAKLAAARAAEERAAKAQSAAQKGKLSQQLAQQKAQTQAELLKSRAEEERRHREIDQGNTELLHQ